jgi:hypothetical protein
MFDASPNNCGLNLAHPPASQQSRRCAWRLQTLRYPHTRDAFFSPGNSISVKASIRLLFEWLPQVPNTVHHIASPTRHAHYGKIDGLDRRCLCRNASTSAQLRDKLK